MMKRILTALAAIAASILVTLPAIAQQPLLIKPLPSARLRSFRRVRSSGGSRIFVRSNRRRRSRAAGRWSPSRRGKPGSSRSVLPAALRRAVLGWRKSGRSAGSPHHCISFASTRRAGTGEHHPGPHASRIRGVLRARRRAEHPQYARPDEGGSRAGRGGPWRRHGRCRSRAAAPSDLLALVMFVVDANRPFSSPAVFP